MSVTIPCVVKHETEKAIQVIVEATGELEWFPLSQVDEIHRDGKGRGSIVVSDWIAAQKGL